MDRIRSAIPLRPVFAFALASAFASTAAAHDKARMHDEMRELAQRVQELKGREGTGALVDALRARYAELSNALGGDDVASILGNGRTGGTQALLTTYAPPGATATTTSFANTNPAAIADLTATTSTIDVTVADTYLFDVDLTTFILHSFAADLDMTLTSPAGTVVVIGTDNGGVNDDVYDGCLFDDQQATPVSDWLYVNSITAGPLTPEGALDRFLGENPNGTWRLTIADDAMGDTGSFTWSLDVTTLSGSTACGFPQSFSNPVPAIIADLGTTTSTIHAFGLAPYVFDLDLTTNLTHTSAWDLDMTLTSPAGTVVVVGTDNASTHDGVYDPCTFDDQQATPVTDWPYVNLTPAGPLTPEGAFARFRGEDPNGTWTLTVTDDTSGGTGSFTWSLAFETCFGGGITPVCYGDGTGAPCGCSNESDVGSNSGCLNSVSPGNVGAFLTADGSPSTTNPDLTLDCSGVLTQPGLMFQGNNTIAGGAGVTFGDGIRCCGGSVLRIATINPPPGPEPVQVQHDITTTPPGVTPGDKRCYQYWYRDPNGPCGSNFNLSNALTATWHP